MAKERVRRESYRSEVEAALAQGHLEASLIKLASGYWASQALLAAVRLGVFEQLADHPQTPRQLARSLHSDPRGLDLLLHALAALGLVKKAGANFRLPPRIGPLLTSRSARSLIPLLRIHHDRFPDWAKFLQVVKRGKPVTAPGLFEKPTARTQRFIAAMEAMAQHTTTALVHTIDLSECSHLLDVGGGSGAYSIAFCRAYPKLRATVLDLPGTLAFTGRYLRAARLHERIRLLAGDYHRVPLKQEYDAILLSHILHSNGPRACQRLLRRLVKALRPGGWLIIRDYLLEPSRTRPLWPALFALNMLLWTAEGRSYSWDEVERWLRALGMRVFKRERVPFLEGEGMIVARR